MYCVNCGVKLAPTEQKCPLCNTTVYHPDVPRAAAEPLYPGQRMPATRSSRKGVSGAVIILFCIPLLICFFADWLYNDKLTWFGYVAGALVVAYVAFALPQWFIKPNPVIFVPSSFVTVLVYLQYIEWMTDGAWFWRFAMPVVGGLGLIVSAVVTLAYYLHRGRLYIFGGAFIVTGVWTVVIEYCLDITFGLRYVGWSVYPLITLALIGALLIYLAIHPAAREVIERKLFF